MEELSKINYTGQFVQRHRSFLIGEVSKTVLRRTFRDKKLRKTTTKNINKIKKIIRNLTKAESKDNEQVR